VLQNFEMEEYDGSRAVKKHGEGGGYKVDIYISTCQVT